MPDEFWTTSAQQLGQLLDRLGIASGDAAQVQKALQEQMAAADDNSPDLTHFARLEAHTFLTVFLTLQSERRKARE